MNCPVCQKQLRDQARFCDYCGAPLSGSAALQQVTSVGDHDISVAGGVGWHPRRQ